MNKVYVNKETNLVEQIINIDVNTRWSKDWFPWCYIVDDENNSLKHHGYRYNLETEKFEEIECYEEPPTIIEKSQNEKIQDMQIMMMEKDKEIEDLKHMIKQLAETNRNEIENLKLALSKII